METKFWDSDEKNYFSLSFTLTFPGCRCVPRLSLAAIRANSALVTPFNTPRSPPVVLRVESMVREFDILPPQSMRLSFV